MTAAQRARSFGLQAWAIALQAAWLVVIGFGAIVQWLAAAFGVAGALILAVPGVDPKWGFAAFLVSNLGWLAFGTKKRHWGLVAQQAVFLITSLIGLWNWWLGPLVLG